MRTGFLAVACGASHTVAVTADVTGRVFAWGDNRDGQTGHEWDDEEQCGGQCIWLPRVVQMPGPEIAIHAVACGANHTLVLSTTGQMYAWGSNSHGQLGTGQVEKREGPPVGVQPVAFETHTLAISCGTTHSAAITIDGALYTWGHNYKYQLGHGDKKTKPVPTQVHHSSSLLRCKLNPDSRLCVIVRSCSSEESRLLRWRVATTTPSVSPWTS